MSRSEVCIPADTTVSGAVLASPPIYDTLIRSIFSELVQFFPRLKDIHLVMQTVLLATICQFDPRPPAQQMVMGTWAVGDWSAVTVVVYDPAAAESLRLTVGADWWAELALPPMKAMGAADLEGLAGQKFWVAPHDCSASQRGRQALACAVMPNCSRRVHCVGVRWTHRARSCAQGLAGQIVRICTACRFIRLR